MVTDAAQGDRRFRAVALTGDFPRARLPAILPVNVGDAGRVDGYPS